ncbi:crAss001_48 related protein [Lelliottia wanjuensis]|uniref:crAss001_48 related protein n=1 Tax=Lelliottia wanjuensis TaxID=3050585 RepID=UPI00254C69B1|nr:hypothetical protein [Lelliottia sp. V86_10]MDK9585426.1 hypothetical protein [Lelliottia sp. V86_10]
MKQYTGTKTINAKPMNRQEYNALRGWTVPADENPEDAGYLVEYTDGGKPNHPDFSGYISWSPADVFERTYHPVFPPHQARVIEELDQLRDRLSKLTAFIEGNPVFTELDANEKSRLILQAEAMTDYANVLASRIANFK